VTGSGESDREGDRVDPAKGAQDWSNTFRFFPEAARTGHFYCE
jgi:hypothetical protein